MTAPFTRSSSRNKNPNVSADPDIQLSESDMQALLALARRSLKRFLDTGKPLRDSDIPEYALNRAVQAEAGAFVTLHRGVELRGCIGSIVSSDPLYRTVMRNAISAATSDPRFTSVRADELDELWIEISVLGPLQPVAGVDEICVGRDGLYLEKDHHRGLLLPQVATEYGWDARQFLAFTARKAGLAPDNTADADIYRFAAVVFGEESRDGRG